MPESWVGEADDRIPTAASASVADPEPAELDEQEHWRTSRETSALRRVSRRVPSSSASRAQLRPARMTRYFPEANMPHYLDDLPDAEFHALDTGHFALEDKCDEIAQKMLAFFDE
jgi:hypothetical protein